MSLLRLSEGHPRQGPLAYQARHPACGALCDRPVVGYGGFGVTYIAWDTMLKRRIAIKEYLPSEFATRMADEQEIMLLDGEKQLSQYQKGLDRFLQEGKRLAQVGDISGIVHMYNCFQANGTAYITMEFLDGRTLEEYLAEKGRLTEQETLDLMMPVLEALQSVHERGLSTGISRRIIFS